MKCANCKSEIPENQCYKITFRLPGDRPRTDEFVLAVMCSACAEKVKSGELKIQATTKAMAEGEKLTHEHIVNIEMFSYP